MKGKTSGRKGTNRKGVTPASARAQADATQIRTLRDQSNAAIARHDVLGIIALLDNEFHVTVGNGGMIQGRDNTAAAFAQQFHELNDVLYVRTIESIEVSASDPLAAEIGTWVGSWTTPRGPLRTGGRYAASWRKHAGAWKVRSELFVTLFCEGPDC